MTKLNTEKRIKETNNNEIKCMLENLYTYEDMEDYTKYTNYNEDDLKELQEDGWVLDVTPGTYNGALDQTDYNELTTENIYSALLEETQEYFFQYLLKCDGENDASKARQVRLVTEYYTVFTIGKHLYIDYD